MQHPVTLPYDANLTGPRLPTEFAAEVEVRCLRPGRASCGRLWMVRMVEVPSAKKRILIGDDDPGMRLALLIRLRANNYDVSCAGDGLSVVAEARKHRPDLILLDLGMPSGDGYTVLNMLQGEESEADIPVIILSARDRAGHEERSKEAGAFLFLQKPVETELLLDSITRALEFSHT